MGTVIRASQFSAVALLTVRNGDAFHVATTKGNTRC